MIGISLQIAECDLEAIRSEIEKGQAMNISDFVRRAINEKIYRNQTGATA